jgi:hypothetical protein
MKTEQEIIDYVNETYPEVSVNGRMKICMQLYLKNYIKQNLEH